MTPTQLDEAAALLRSHFREEAQSGFARLRRTPSSGVIRLLDYIDTLDSTGRDSLLEALAQMAALQFSPPAPPVRERQEEVRNLAAAAAYFGAIRSQRFTMGLRHTDLRMRRAMLADQESVKMMAQARVGLDFTPRDDMPPELVPDPDHFTPAKAPLLRKLIDKAFKDAFAGAKRKLPGGETVYSGSWEGTGATVRVDFAAMGLQFRYTAGIPDETRTTFLSRLAYEDLWAAGTGWDYLTEENAAASVELLCERIGQIVRLRNAIWRIANYG